MRSGQGDHSASEGADPFLDVPYRPTRATQVAGLRRALIYTRVSRVEQAQEGVSLDAQLAACRHYVAQEGWIVAGEYQDVMTGTRDDRPQYQALLAEARRLRSDGKPVAVIVRWLHRFGRRIAERVRCWEEFKRLAVPVHSLAEGGEVPELIANILASVAQEETRQLGERVSVAWQYVRSQGWHMVGRAPWGYVWRPATSSERSAGAPKLVLDVDPIAAPYALEVFRRVAGGESGREVARWATTLPADARQGLSLKHDRTMGWRSVQRMLRSPAYISRDCGPREAKLDPVAVLGHPRCKWPALVDDPTWLVVQRRMQQHQYVPRQGAGHYLLTGLIRCSRCNARMQGMLQGHGPRYRCGSWYLGARAQRCSFVLPTPHADVPVIDKVSGLLDGLTSRVPVVQTALEHAWRTLEGSSAPDASKRVQRLETTLSALRERIVRAAELLCDSQIEKSTYDALCAKASAEAEAAESELARLRSVEPPRKLPALDDVLKDIGSWAETFAQIEAQSHPIADYHTPEGRAALRPNYSRAQRDVLALLIERVAAVRVAHATYQVEITWTALGEAMHAALAATNADPQQARNHIAEPELLRCD